MGLWKTIKKWFAIPKRNSRNSRTTDLYPLNVDDIAKELKLEEDARRFGEKGLPAPDATVLDGPEERIIQRIEKARQDYLDWASLRLAILKEDLANLDATQLVNRALQADEEFERKASTLLAESASSTGTLAEVARRSQQELVEFRDHHKLRRHAHLLSRGESYFRYALLVLLIVIEGGVNASFFSQGLAGGLIGGFLWAAFFALVNLSAAFLLGKFAVPFVFHFSVIQKIRGYLGIAAALFCMLGISLMIAHYRDALVADAIEPAKAVLEAVKSRPLSLSDINSWILFAISCAFAVVALFDGLYSDDPYPKYGKVARRAVAAGEDYLEEIGDLRSQLEELKRNELMVLEENMAKAESLLSQRNSLIQAKETAESRLRTALDNAHQSMRALLAMYRTINELHRNGLSRPAYYAQPVQLKTLTLPDFSTREDEAIKIDQQLLIERLLSKIEILRANIQASFNKKYDRLTPLDDHFERDVGEV